MRRPLPTRPPIKTRMAGSREAVGQLSSLAATNSGLRVLKHVGGSVPDILGCIKYVKSCRDADSGSFAPMPGGKPDVVTTAIGLMAASELKIADPAMIKEAADYLGKNAKTFEEVRMAIAGLEAVHGTSPDFSKWNESSRACATPTAPGARGRARPIATGGAGAAVLRMGLKLDKRDAVIAALKAGQRPEGGWSKDAGPPDLGATYRDHAGTFHAARKARHRAVAGVHRALPAVRRQLREQARRRRRPGRHVHGHDRDLLGAPARRACRPSSRPPVSRRWSTARAWPAGKETPSSGRVKDGMLIGHSPGLNHNEFLATTATYGDFVLSLYFRMIDGKGNSGVQFRSVRIPAP